VQFGGKLEVVERLVIDRLANAQRMGVNSSVTSRADTVIVAGSTAFSGSEYLRAYRSLTGNSSASDCQR